MGNLDIEKIKEFERSIELMEAEKLSLFGVINQVCIHNWCNSGITLQGKPLMICLRCDKKKQTVL